MESRALLAAFAHPDDEAFGSGGILAHYTAQGVRAELVCATRGEVGEIADPALATRETLGQVRERELRCAASILGVADVTFLDYRDSGMPGAPENADPRAYCNASANEVVRRLVRIIRRFKPQVVLTFEPGGGYGHPDHVAISRHATAAFHAAGDAATFPDLGPAWQAARLFYPVLPRSFFDEVQRRLEQLGIDAEQFGGVEGPRGFPDEQVTCTIDVSDQVETKWRAFMCHQTQLGTYRRFTSLPEDAMKAVLSRESFVLASPAPTPGLRLGDLFEGL